VGRARRQRVAAIPGENDIRQVAGAPQAIRAPALTRSPPRNVTVRLQVRGGRVSSCPQFPLHVCAARLLGGALVDVTAVARAG
jgi:hypothetical protein